MNSLNSEKKHHYIPVFYLKGFTNSDGCLWVYDKEGAYLFPSSPEGIAYDKNYFSFTGTEGGKVTETVENAMAALEGESAKVLKKIHNNELLVEQERFSFAYFVASMLLRAPNFRNNIQSATAEMIKHLNTFMASNKEKFEQTMGWYEKDTGEKVDVANEDFCQWMLNPENYSVSVDSEYAVGMALSLIEKPAMIFFNMKWMFLIAPDSFKFLTSDNPLSYLDLTIDSRTLYRGVGLTNKNIEVTLPLSKDILAFGGWDLKEGFVKVNKQTVKDLNVRTVRASRRIVFTNYKLQDTDMYVKKYKKKSSRDFPQKKRKK